MKKLVLAAVSALVSAAVVVPVNAAEQISLLLTGRNGQIRGEITQKGRENQIEILRLELGGTAPISASSGMATGRRQWDTVKITKRLDRATVPIVQAFVTNETMPSAEFRVTRVTAEGREEQYYTVKLTNAVVVSDHILGPAEKDPATGQAWGGSVEELSLTFQKITITNNPNNTQVNDDWNLTH